MGGIADTIYYNGTILTMNDSEKTVEAVAVAGDTIAAVGSFENVKKYADANTRYVDLKGKTLMPGFIDAHSHILDTALRALWVDVNSFPLGGVRCIDDVVRLLKEKADKTPEGEWVVGWGYDDSKIKEMRHLTAEDLDKASIKHPVSVWHISGWVTYHNTLALKKGGIDDAVPDTEYYRIVRDEKGKASGIIETALCPVMAKIPAADGNAFMRGLEEVSKQYTAKGCTTSQEGWWCTKESAEQTKKAIDEDLFRLRIVLYPVGEGDVYENSGHTLYPELKSGEYVDAHKKICMGAMKLTADGSIQARTARLSRPYYVCPDDKPGFLGPYNHEQEWLNERILEFHRQGKQVAVHCNGDGAIEMVINACEYAQKMFYREDPRFIFIHCQTVRFDQLKRIAALKASISFFPVHTYYWGERHYNIFLGPERAMRLDPVREAMDLGINCTLHNDTYVTPIDPLLCVWSAVNRQSCEGRDLGKAEQGVDVYRALKAVTINAAVQGFEEKVKGSIEPGKLADFVLFDENPLEIDEWKIKDLRILATIVGNKIVYGAIEEESGYDNV